MFQTRIEGLEGFAELTTDSSNVTRAVQTFTHPDVESPEKATAVALGRKLQQATPAPRDTTITVLNGNGRTGSASTAGCQLGERGYQILTPPNGLPANAPSFDYFRTKVYFEPGRRGARTRSGQGREPLRLGGGGEPARGDLAALERRDADDRRRSDLPRQPRRGSDRPDSAARASERRLRGERVAGPAARAAEARAVPAHGPDRDREKLLDGQREPQFGRTGSTRTASTRPCGSSTAWARTSTGAWR